MTDQVPKTVAIVGASSDRSKYGNKSVRAHLAQGWTVYPVNPKEETIEGLKAYKHLSDIPAKIIRVSMYVPPQVGMTLLDEIANVSPEEVFLNPGADSPELVKAASAKGLPVAVACSIVDVGRSPAEFA